MTIKELIEELKKFPADTPVAAFSADYGEAFPGWDVVVYQEEEGGSVYIKCEN